MLNMMESAVLHLALTEWRLHSQDDEFRDFIVDDEVPDGQQRQPRRRLARKDPHLGHISNAALRVRFS